MAELVSGIAKEQKSKVKSTSPFLLARKRQLVNSRSKLEEKRRSRSVHTYSNEEKLAFVFHMNNLFKNDPDLSSVIPFDPDTDDIFDAIGQGVILCKWLNTITPGIVPKFNLKPRNGFEVLENLNVALEAVKELKIKTVNIGAKDLQEKKVHIILGLMWQVMRAELAIKISVETHPEMAKFIDQKSSNGTLEQTLLLWINNILSETEYYEQVTNFDVDVMDSAAYTYAMNQIAPDQCNLSPLDEEDLDARAELMLKEAEKIDCREFFEAEHISNGNTKLNITFMTNLFNKHSELEKQRELEEKNRPAEEKVPEKVEDPVVPEETVVVQIEYPDPICEPVPVRFDPVPIRMEPEPVPVAAKSGLPMGIILLILSILVVLAALVYSSL
eukprot:TRINITY_DN3578_c0_g1_i2.p1 TRINITY_DN3578_c0_g1~~TRINITY_DN3578_c0_g1_i2.p1  ORF type:complete len:386 (-),score=87.68 TRINITY_DN3578_c0_g1_i2:58-1215(-)